jgi:hypothetical protein
MENIGLHQLLQFRLTHWSRELEKPIVSRLLWNHVSTTGSYSETWMQPTPYNPVSWILSLILSSQEVFFYFCSDAEILCVFLLSPIRATYLTNVSPFDFVNIRGSNQEYRLVRCLPVVRSKQTPLLSFRVAYKFAVSQYAFSFRRARIKYFMIPVERSIVMPPGVVTVSSCTFLAPWRRDFHFVFS